MNLGHLDFDIVSDFDIRISDFASLGPSTSVERPLQISSFMQNKANLLDAQMNVSAIITKDYVNKPSWKVRKNKANSKPNKANLLNDQMNVTSLIKVDYENIANWTLDENKANTNPIQTQSKPISVFNHVKLRKPQRRYFNRQIFSAAAGFIDLVLGVLST